MNIVENVMIVIVVKIPKIVQNAIIVKIVMAVYMQSHVGIQTGVSKCGSFRRKFNKGG